MKQLFTVLLVAGLASAASAQTTPPAAAASAPATPHHECVDQGKAQGLKGEELKKFIAQCKTDREAKKAACKDQTKDLKGKERSSALKECLAK